MTEPECLKLRTTSLEALKERVRKRLMEVHGDVEEVEQILKRLLGDESSKRRFSQG